MEELQQAARGKEAASADHMKHHVVLARSVTFFQIAIALAAIAVLTKKSGLWLASLALGALNRGRVLCRRAVLRERVCSEDREYVVVAAGDNPDAGTNRCRY